MSKVLYSKKNYSKEVEIDVLHPRYPGAVFGFAFAKEMSDAAAEAQKDFFALTDAERPEVRRQKLITTIALMLTREPSGFDEFPQDARPLPERVREYFDEPEQPELHAILVAAWNRYWEVSVPRAYLKSVEDSQPGTGQLSAVSL